MALPPDYDALVEEGPTLVWRAGADGVPDYFNRRWLEFTGRRLDEEIGGWKDRVHPEDRLAFGAVMRGALARQAPFVRRYRLRRLDGEYRPMLERARPVFASGLFAGHVGHATELEVEDAVPPRAGADEFFEMALDHLCVAGFDGYWKRLNPSWMRTLGWSEEELKSRPLVDFAHPDDRTALLASRERIVEGRPMGRLANRYRCKDGTYRWFEWRSIADEKRGVVFAAARDVTDERLAEEQLRDARAREEELRRQLVFSERMASLGTLAAGVAHEINNPLAYVAANVHLILEALDDDEPDLGELVEMAQEAQAGAERIRRIVRGLKTFSRADAERRDVVDLRPVLELAINMSFNEIRHRARLVKEYGALPPVEADEARLGQVFVNLLVNAAQAVGEGDPVANEIRIVASTDDAGRAVVEVRDTGPGIPAEILGRIFDPFFTTKPVGVGTGLGLSICHSIVAAMGGELTASNRAEGGASFRVVLPPAKSDAVRRPERDAVIVEPARRATVLVVDDEAAVGNVVRRVLASDDVTAVTRAKEALRLLDEGRTFDVVLSDVLMPELSGMELFDELVLRHPDVARRMVFLTGGAFTPAARAFLERVPNERLDKPFDPESLRAIVRRLAA